MNSYYVILNPATDSTKSSTSQDFSTLSAALAFYSAHVSVMPNLRILRVSITQVLDVTPGNEN